MDCRRCRVLQGVLVGLIVLGAPGLLLREKLLPGLPMLAFVGVASGSFVLLSLVAGGLRSASGRLMVAGLAACAAGDLLGPGSFLLGVACFLVGHLLFIAAYVLRRGETRRGLLVLALFVALSAVVLGALYDRLAAPERLLIIAYALVISVMVGAAASTVRLPGGRLVLAAAIVFYVSDFFVATWHLVGGDFPYRFFCYPLYYGACTMLAFGAGAVSTTAEAGGE